jgi:hypothetical protein
MKIKFATWTIPIAILLCCGLAYGLLIGWLGFYWDDWPTLWFLDRFGSGIFSRVYAIDRPALGWLFTLTTSIVGKSPLAWQIFSILTRWLASLSLWWMLQELWPGRKMEVTWVAFLFALYPGFRQQPIAFTYSADWIAIALFFFSFWLMIRAVRGSHWFWLLFTGSWLIAAYVMFADEYYFGLELLRPVILWLVIGQSYESISSGKRLKKVVFYWIPYIVIMAIFLFWRLFVFVSPRGQVQLIDQLINQPLATIFSLLSTILKDIIQSGLTAWAQIINLRNLSSLEGAWVGVYLLLILLATIAAIFYFLNLGLNRKAATPDDRNSQKNWAYQALILGGLALFFGGWPFWMTALPIDLYFPWDRFNLAMMFGASLVLAGLVVWFLRTSVQKAMVFGIIAGLTIGFHLYNTNLYRQDWQLQKEFFWQLTWRAPQLKQNTLLLTADMPFRYYSDNSLTAPLNLIYAPDNRSLQIPFMLYNIESRLGAGLTDLQENLPINQAYRIATFQGNTSDALVFFFDPPRCLKIIDPDADQLLPNKPLYMDEAADLSNLNRIITNSTNPAIPMSEYFGPEPELSWCAYFEKAELARQQRNWSEVARLADLALEIPHQLTQSNAAELTPFIQGYAKTGQWEKAIQLTQRAHAANPKLANMLCPIWYDIRQNQSAQINNDDQYNLVFTLLNCQFDHSSRQN